MERRFWLGVGILTVFLALGLWVTKSMSNVHEPVAQALEQAAQAALDGDLQTGISLADTAKNTWQAHWNGTAAVADHEPMEQIDGLFAQLETYATAGESANFAAYCARLSQLIEAMGDAHDLNWWNLL